MIPSQLSSRVGTLRVAATAVMVMMGAGTQAEARDTDASARKHLEAVRATGTITVDGRLDEPDWERAPLAKDFVQSEPHPRAPATADTEVRVLYDGHTLYVGVFARDPHPGRVIVSELRKDFATESNDTFELVLDTFHDERNGYMFAINAKGAKWDAQMTNEGREINADWDGIWTVKTTVGADGWYAELAIPLRSLKFHADDAQSWGVNFMRRNRHLNEESYWAPLPRIYQLGQVSLAGILENLRGLHGGKDIRVKPYALASASRTTRSVTSADVGLDAKIGIGAGFSADLTLNTDFSQVEVDEQQINLTRFSLFFPEKRDFFLENSGIFQFGPSQNRLSPGSVGGSAGTSTSSTANAGGGGRQGTMPADLLLFFSRSIGLSSSAQAIPILGGSRLTGRTGRYTVGALTIQQREANGSPATNFTVVRLRRDTFANSDMGVMLLNKQSAGGAYNRVAGADANFRFIRYLNLNVLAAKTFSPSHTTPGQGHDTSVLAGASWRDAFWDLRASYLNIGSRFNDEMGFVPRVGVNKLDTFVGVHWRPKAVSKWIREINPHWVVANVTRTSGGLDSRYIDYHLPFNFQNGAFVEMGQNPSVEDVVRPFVISNRYHISVQPGRYDFAESFVTFRTNRAAPFSVSGRYAAGPFYDGYKRGYQMGAAARVNTNLSVSASYTRNAITLSDEAFATNLFVGRVNYSFSTRMFLNALVQYNSDSGSWTSNVRFNVIHRPLSDFFLVYNEQGLSTTSALVNRTVMAKLTYMMAF